MNGRVSRIDSFRLREGSQRPIIVARAVQKHAVMQLVKRVPGFQLKGALEAQSGIGQPILDRRR